MTAPEEFDRRLARAVQGMTAQPELSEALTARVDAFFTRHSEIQRTRGAEALATVIVFEEISQASDSQSVAGTQSQTQKVA